MENNLQKNISVDNVLFSLDETGNIVCCNTNLLMEASSKGYNPLSNTDLKNYLEGRAPENLNRNIILCGGNENRSLGQSEYSETDFDEFMSNHPGVEINVKSGNDYLTKNDKRLRLSDFTAVKQKQLLEQVNDDEVIDIETNTTSFNIFEESVDTRNAMEIDDSYRKHLAKAFGSENIKRQDIEDSGIVNESKELIKSGNKVEALLELIKELKVLGYTAEEIKKEIQKF